MADYKLQARIPQDTADKLFKVIKEVQEVTTVADVTTSSITRAALDTFIKDHENKSIKIEIEKSKISDEEIVRISEQIKELRDKATGGAKAFYQEISKVLINEELDRISIELDSME